MVWIDYIFAVVLGMICSALLLLGRLKRNAIIGKVADEQKMYLNRPMQIEYQEDRIDY